MSDAFRLKALREQRGKIGAEIQAIGLGMKGDKAGEQRAMSPDERVKFEALKADWVKVGEAIKVVDDDIASIDQILADVEADTPAENSRVIPGKEDRSVRRAERGADDGRRLSDARIARQAWARAQYDLPLSREHLAACQRVGVNPNSKEMVLSLGDPHTRAERMQKRALSVTTSGGGYLIPQDYSFELESKLLDFSAVRGVCREVTTESGADLPWPTEDDTGNEGELLGINTEIAYADPTFSSVTFGAYKFSSKGVLVPNELIQDSAFDVDSMVFGAIGARIGRKQAEYFTTGSGSSQPKGIVTCASAGNTTASATAFTANELTILEHTVNRAYRKNPGVGYMMKDDVVAYVMTLLNADNTPLFRVSFREGSNAEALMINGYPVYVNTEMAGLTSNLPSSASKHVLFGDFKKFIVRDAGPVRVKKLEERYAEKDQVGFVGFLRSDSNCVNTSAIKYLLQAT